MKIKKNYTKTATSGSGTQAVGTQKCPKCQQEIPLTEWKEHMKLELMDPKWREEKLKRDERAKLNSLADGDEISRNLRRMAPERRDVFGQRDGPTGGDSIQAIASGGPSVGGGSGAGD